MKALVTTPGAPGGIALQDVPEPEPQLDEAVIRVHASSLNRGELRLIAARAEGWRPGQDVAGVVCRAAADGSGPAAGTRVVALADAAGWAQQVAVPTDRIGTLPAAVNFTHAAALPIAGTTALRTLRIGGDLSGQRVLVTGASGGVGRFQVQLAARDGAHVAAVAASRDKADLRVLGAVEIVPTPAAASGLFHLITESVGGSSLSEAIDRVAAGGAIVVFGSSTGEPTPFGFRQFSPGHEGARIQTFMSYASGPGFGADLEILAGLVAAGRLRVDTGLKVAWTDVHKGLDALRERRVVGKAVLVIDPEHTDGYRRGES